MKFKYREYESGLRLFVAPKEDTQAVTVMVLVGVGSNHEKEGQFGLAHFLEHMCFKGTVKRPATIDVVGELDGLGAQYNAFTSNGKTGYYVKARKDHIGRVMDIISDIYLNSTFPEKEMEKEKGVIVEEIRMRNDDPQTIVYEAYTKLIHGDQPDGRPIAGSIDSVRSMTQDQINKFHRRFYNAKNTVIVVAGAVDTKKVYRLVKDKFASLKKGTLAPKIKPKNSQKSSAVSIVHKTTDQAHLLLGFRAVSVGSKESMALRVLSTILGGSMSSRLFSKLREELGIAYYVGAMSDMDKYYGLLTIYAGVDKTRIEEAVTVLLEECYKMKNDLIWLGEIERAKEYLLGHMALNLESSNSFASFLGNQSLNSDIVLTPDAFAERIRAVTGEEVLALAKKIFVNKNANLAVIGPYKSSRKLEKILTKFE